MTVELALMLLGVMFLGGIIGSVIGLGIYHLVEYFWFGDN